jgi:hypothetical protein
VRKWLVGQHSKDFYAAGFGALERRWDNFINVQLVKKGSAPQVSKLPRDCFIHDRIAILFNYEPECQVSYVTKYYPV